MAQVPRLPLFWTALSLRRSERAYPSQSFIPTQPSFAYALRGSLGTPGGNDFDLQ